MVEMEKYKSLYSFKHVSFLSLVIGALFGLVMTNSQDVGEQNVGIGIFAGILVMFFLISVLYPLAMMNSNAKIRSRNKSREKYNKVVELIESLAKKHFRALDTKYHQLIKVDPYGNEDCAPYIKEIQYFYEKVFLPSADEANIALDVAGIGFDDFFNLLHDALSMVSAEIPSELETQLNDKNRSISPVEFEIHCSEILKSVGWTARMTKGSGDQGIDIIAEKGSLKAVLQCKYYSKPVGNKAVQEVYAGKQHERADVAAVVTDNSYTKAATDLARNCNVMLLHYSELKNFDSLILKFV